MARGRTPPAADPPANGKGGRDGVRRAARPQVLDRPDGPVGSREGVERGPLGRRLLDERGDSVRLADERPQRDRIRFRASGLAISWLVPLLLVDDGRFRAWRPRQGIVTP